MSRRVPRPNSAAAGRNTRRKSGVNSPSAVPDADPAGAVRNDITWEEGLRDFFSADIVRRVQEFWRKADADGNNALCRDEMQGFMDDLYQVTGTPAPPDSVLRAEIVDLFRKYDLDRNMLIEVGEMCFYLKYSHFAKNIARKHRAKGSGRPRSAQPGAGEPAGAGGSPTTAASDPGAAGDGVAVGRVTSDPFPSPVRRESATQPWMRKDRVVSERTIPLLRSDAVGRIAAAVRDPRAVGDAACCADSFVAADELEPAARAFRRMWDSKSDSVLDELACNLRAPEATDSGGRQCYAQLLALADACAARFGPAFPPDTPRVGLVVLALLGGGAAHCDRLLGWGDVPAAGAPPDELAAYSPRNPPLRETLISAANSGGDGLKRWVKVSALLLAMARPPGPHLKGKELAFTLPSTDGPIAGAAKGAAGCWLAPTVAVLGAKPRAAGPGCVKVTQCDACVDLRPFGDDAVVLPPMQALTVTAAGGGEWACAIAAPDSDSLDELRRNAAGDVQFADRQLDMVRSVVHEKLLHCYGALFSSVFAPSSVDKGLTQSELVSGFKKIGEPLDTENEDDVFGAADTDRNGFVDIVEFCAALMRPPPAAAKPQPKAKPGGKKGKPAPKGGGGDASLPRAREVHAMWQTVVAAAPAALDRLSAASRAKRPERYLPPTCKQVKKQRVRKMNTIPMEFEEGDILELGPGTYTGMIAIDTNVVTIRGPKDGPRPVITAGGKEKQATVTLSSKRVVLENVEIDNSGEGYAVWMKGGFHDLINCTIRAQKGGVLCDPGTNLHVQGCAVHEIRNGWGLCMKGSAAQNSTGIIDASTFRGCFDGGVVVEKNAAPWVGGCEFSAGRGCGVVYAGGGGVLADCDVTGNACSGVFIEQGSNPLLYRNRVHGNTASGVKVTKQGLGVLEENDLHGNGDNEIESTKQAAPVCRRNIIHDGKTSGVFVAELGRGVFEDNEIRSYPVAGLAMGPKSQATVRGNVIWYDSAEHPAGHAVGIRPGALGSVCENLFVGWDGTRGAVAREVHQKRGSGARRASRAAWDVETPSAFDISGDHDCCMERNWTAPTLEEARADRRAWLFERFGGPAAPT